MSNGNGGGMQLPTWARAVAIVGIPGTIACFLVWMGARELPRAVSAAEGNTIRLEALAQRQQESALRDAELFRLMQRICANVARTPDDRQRCFDK